MELLRLPPRRLAHHRARVVELLFDHEREVQAGDLRQPTRDHDHDLGARNLKGEVQVVGKSAEAPEGAANFPAALVGEGPGEQHAVVGLEIFLEPPLQERANSVPLVAYEHPGRAGTLTLALGCFTIGIIPIVVIPN